MVERSGRNGDPGSDQDIPPGFHPTKLSLAKKLAKNDLPPGFHGSQRYGSSSESSDDEDSADCTEFEQVDEKFDQGKWWYACVETKGAAITDSPGDKVGKRAVRLPFGEMVWISERGFVDGLYVLHLGDGRGWVNVSKGKQRLMSECFRENLDPPQIFSALGKAVVYPSPCFYPAVKTSTLLVPGELILSRERASVCCKGKKGEERMVFYKIDSRAGLEYSRKSGWSVQCVNGVPVIAPIRLVDVEPEWYVVVHDRGIGLRSGPTTSVKARLTAKDAGLPHGEFVCIVQKAYQNECVYLKLQDGGWVFEAKGEARTMVRVIAEHHAWTYICCDKQGADIRKAPSRASTKKTGRKVKHRQRIVITEKARVGDEVYLRCAPPIDGWVTECKRGGERKMRPLHPMNEGDNANPEPGSSATFSRPPSSYHDGSSYVTPHSSHGGTPSSRGFASHAQASNAPRAPIEQVQRSMASLATRYETPPASARRHRDVSPHAPSAPRAHTPRAGYGDVGRAPRSGYGLRTPPCPGFGLRPPCPASGNYGFRPPGPPSGNYYLQPPFPPGANYGARSRGTPLHAQSNPQRYPHACQAPYPQY